MRDEAEIRGHRRTYIGAMPGRIIQGLKRVGTKNPVFMLDEIDKVGADWRGDPSSALLEVLDPEQNREFRDHYLDVPFDLSQVMFITTANMLSPIPAPLRDRMEILELDGYTEEEKVGIAQQYLLPRQIRENSLRSRRDLVRARGAAQPSSATIPARRACATWSGRSARCAARLPPRLPSGRHRGSTSRPTTWLDYLGKPRFYFEAAERTEVPGVATGLVWTPTGGDITFIEATRMTGSKRLILTGKLGDVMKESAQAARQLRPLQGRRAGHRRGDLSQERHPHPRAGRRGAQGWPVGRRDHGHGPGIAADASALSAPTWP